MLDLLKFEKKNSMVLGYSTGAHWTMKNESHFCMKKVHFSTQNLMLSKIRKLLQVSSRLNLIFSHMKLSMKYEKSKKRPIFRAFVPVILMFYEIFSIKSKTLSTEIFSDFNSKLYPYEGLK